MVEPVMIAPIPMVTLLNLSSPAANVTFGFTAATGASYWQLHSVFDWWVSSGFTLGNITNWKPVFSF